MDILQGLESGKLRLGSLCKRKHDWNGTGQSVRRVLKGRTDAPCVDCQKLTHSRYTKAFKSRLKGRTPSSLEIQLGVDCQAYYLGNLTCGHNYKDSGYSLRRIGNRQCVQCESERVKENRIRDRKKFSDRGKEYYAKNREEVLRRQKEYYSIPENADKRREGTRVATRKYRSSLEYKNKLNIYREARRTQIRERNRQYKRTKRGKACLAKSNHQRRCKKLNQHFSTYSIDEMMVRYAEFKDQCAYCGNISAIGIDHFIPFTLGGSDVIGNIIPCCEWCNSSKCNSDPFEWYSRQSFYKKSRWKRILKVLGKTQRNYMQIPLI
ncbi:MAG: HNH endonuclease [Cyanobacteria bacterium P01_A01_bin.123]